MYIHFNQRLCDITVHVKSVKNKQIRKLTSSIDGFILVGDTGCGTLVTGCCRWSSFGNTR